MAHVTFIHGIANKPAADELLAIWRRALGEGGTDTLRLGTQGVTSRLVYWSDVLYAEPDPDVAAHEGVHESTAEAVDGGGDPPMPTPVSPESAAFIEALRSRLTDLPDEELEREPPVPPAAKGLERVPLPWFIKKRIMAAYLRDVHHYLFNVEWTPRPRDTYKVQEEIRRRFLAALNASDVSRPHVVVSHSMGTVIAYDCLKRVSDCPKVDGLITLGSPLGIDEIQDKLRPEWSRDDGFPGEKVGGSWINVYDCLDVVCGPDPKFGNDYRRGAKSAVEDVEVSNDGAWRHSATKYYRQPAVRRALRRLIGL
jgi:pimeloyl-ACP methyl ester carboxylesterase